MALANALEVAPSELTRQLNRRRVTGKAGGEGGSLARLRGRQDDAVKALRKAELISPARVQRHPFTREVLGELLVRSRRDAVGRELRGMAYRTGLPV